MTWRLILILVCVPALTLSSYAGVLVNPGFEEIDDEGRLAGWIVHTGLDSAEFDVIVPGRRLGGRDGSSACAGFPAEGTTRIETHEHTRVTIPKAALSQTVTVEPGTYAVAAHLRTASGDRWSGGFSLGISTGAVSSPVTQVPDDALMGETLAARGIGRHPRNWGEWQRHESPAITVEQTTDITVWIFFHFINSNVMSAAWEVDDVELVTDPSGPVSHRSPFEWEPRVHIYDPSVSEDERWYINDHCFVQDDDGKWHLFGITHAEPLAPLDEKEFAHATADSLLQTPWEKHPPAFRVNEEKGEKQLWAPHVIRKDGLWYMFYCAGGPDTDSYQINLRTSKDLWNWEWHDGNPLFTDIGDARDPMVLEEDGLYRMYYCRPTDSPWRFGATYMRTSTDLLNWSEPQSVFVSNSRPISARNVESPFVLKLADDYLLFVCGENGYSDTSVYWSDSPDHFHTRNFLTSLNAHAAEILNVDGDLYYSHCGWGQGGVYLSRGRQVAESLRPPNIYTSTLQVQVAERLNKPENIVAIYYEDGNERHLVDKSEPGDKPGLDIVFSLAPATYSVVVQSPSEELVSAQVELIHGKATRVTLE